MGSRRALQSVLEQVHQVRQQRWLASVFAPAHAVLETRAKRQMLCAGTETLPPVLLTLPVLARWTIHPVRLRLDSVSAITVSFVVWKESWRRAQRCCCTSSARSDNQTSSCIPLFRFGTTTIHDIWGQAWVAPCTACGEQRPQGSSGRRLFWHRSFLSMTARASGAPSSSGSPERRSTARPHCARVQSTVRLSLARSGMAAAALGAWRSQCTAARARHARLGTTPAYFAPSVTTRCTATDQSLDRSTFCGCKLRRIKVLRSQGAVTTRFCSIGYRELPTAVHPLAESCEKFGDAALGRSALAMRPSCPP